jgi:hypothetical protein
VGSPIDDLFASGVETYFDGEKKAVALAPGVWTNLPNEAVGQGHIAGQAAKSSGAALAVFLAGVCG